MFTGIIRHIGTVLAIGPTAAGKKLTIDIGPLAAGLHLGDSIAVDGACLTASALAGAAAEFDVVTETLSRTTLGQLRAGTRVNLENALQLGQGLDGHMVQGHVDGMAKLAAQGRGGQPVLEFSCPRELADMMVPKGSVAVSGVSLTLVDVGGDRFSVAIIPTTLRETTLGELAVADKVNIETDIIGKYVMKCVRQLQLPAAGRITMDKLREEGFM